MRLFQFLSPWVSRWKNSTALFVGAIALFVMSFAAPARATLTIPASFDAETFAETALGAAGPIVTILVTIGFTVLGVVVIYRLVRGAVRKFSA